MFKKALLLVVTLLILTPLAQAKNTAVIRVSCTIPQRVQLPTNDQEKTPQNNIIQTEEKISDGQKVLVKTVVAK